MHYFILNGLFGKHPFFYDEITLLFDVTQNIPRSIQIFVDGVCILLFENFTDFFSENFSL